MTIQKNGLCLTVALGMTLLGISGVSGAESLTVDARINAIDLLDYGSAIAFVSLDTLHNYTVTASGSASFGASSNPSSSVFTLYAIPDANTQSGSTSNPGALGSGGSMSFQNLTDNYFPFFAYFADVGDLTDNSGGFTLDFLDTGTSTTTSLQIDAQQNAIDIASISNVALVSLVHGTTYSVTMSGSGDYGSDNPIDGVHMLFSGLSGRTQQYMEPGDVFAFTQDGTDPFRAWVTDQNGRSDNRGSFVLTFTPVPVPEPASMALLGVGLAGLVATHLRKKNRVV